MGEFQSSSATRFPFIFSRRRASTSWRANVRECANVRDVEAETNHCFFCNKASDTALQLNIQPASSGNNNIPSAEPEVYQPNLEDNIQLTDSATKLQELDHQGSTKFIFVTI